MSTDTYTEAAKKIRADLKAAIADGSLTLPDGAVVSVRKKTASCMVAIGVNIKGLPDSWALAQIEDAPGRYERTEKSKVVGAKLREIADRHFDYDGRHTFLGIGLDSGAGVISL